MYNSSPLARDIRLAVKYEYENEVVYDSFLTEKKSYMCFLRFRSEDTERRARYDKLLSQLISISHTQLPNAEEEEKNYQFNNRNPFSYFIQPPSNHFFFFFSD